MRCQLGNMRPIFLGCLYFRNLHLALHRGNQTTFPWTMHKSFFSTISYHDRLLLTFLLYTIMTGVRCHLITIIIWISMMIKKHFFKHLLAICRSASGKYLFHFLSYFYELLNLLMLIFVSYFLLFGFWSTLNGSQCLLLVLCLEFALGSGQGMTTGAWQGIRICYIFSSTHFWRSFRFCCCSWSLWVFYISQISTL